MYEAKLRDSEQLKITYALYNKCFSEERGSRLDTLEECGQKLIQPSTHGSKLSETTESRVELPSDGKQRIGAKAKTGKQEIVDNGSPKESALAVASMT